MVKSNNARLDLSNLISDFDLKGGAEQFADAMRGNALPDAMRVLEARLIRATWTLRRLPDKEKGYLASKGPAVVIDGEDDPEQTAFDARLRARISRVELDDYQEALDLLLVLPDTADRQLVFWTAWAQEGLAYQRIQWAQVARYIAKYSDGNRYAAASRWTLKRNYERSLEFIAAAQINKNTR